MANRRQVRPSARAITAHGNCLVQRKFSQSSERVKGVDLHPTEPWCDPSAHSAPAAAHRPLQTRQHGHTDNISSSDRRVQDPRQPVQWPGLHLQLCRWGAPPVPRRAASHAPHTTQPRTAPRLQALIKSFEAADLPARCSKFIARKQWVAIGSDDMFIRVFNYNTMEREKMFEAHGDYIRSVAVHPSLPYLLSCSDDMLIKLWDWDKGWKCTQVFEGHVHYVMQARAPL